MTEAWALFIVGIVCLFCSVACAPKPHAAPVPAAPPIAKQKAPIRRKLTPRAEDTFVHNCTVTRENSTTADCLCRHPTTQIDSKTGTITLDCRKEK